LDRALAVKANLIIPNTVITPGNWQL